MVGLSNVDNTSDLNKPVSTSTQNALDLKEDVANKSTDVALGTSDVLYPTQNAVKSYVDSKVIASAPTFTEGTAGTDFNITSAGSAYTLNIPDASATARGLVTINNQVFNGSKTFSSDLNVNGLTIGKGAGQNDQNTAIGNSALGSGTGTRNTAVGYSALLNYSGTSFDNNSGIGYNNMVSLTSGQQNTSIGAETMMSVTTGSKNTAIGAQTFLNSTGDDNTGLGYHTGSTITTGTRNTLIGSEADVSSGSFTNATAIGYTASVDASNKIQLGNTSVTSVSTSGKLTTGTVTYPNTDGTNGQALTTNGSGTVSWSSVLVRDVADEFTATAFSNQFYFNSSAFSKQ